MGLWNYLTYWSPNTANSGTGPNPEEWYHETVPDYPHNLASGNNAPDAVELYRKILATQPDNSVTIVVVGWLTNMANLPMPAMPPKTMC